MSEINKIGPLAPKALEVKKNTKEAADGAFAEELLKSAQAVDQEIDHLTLDDIDMVILDNISELRTYSNDERVKSLLDLLNEIWEKSGKGLMIYHINNRPNDGVGEIASEMGLEILEIPNYVFTG